MKIEKMLMQATTIKKLVPICPDINFQVMNYVRMN